MTTREEPERGTEAAPQESARALAMDRRGPVGRVGPIVLARSLSRVVLFLVSLTLFLVAIELIKHGATGAAGLISRYLDINSAHSALGFGWSASYLVMSGSPEPATLLGVIERSEERARVEQALQKGKEWLAGAPAPRTKGREGQAGEQILEEAASGEYDLLVVGTRGRQGITRFLLGSTAERIARQAAEPVLLVQGERDSVERILVCTAGGKPGLAAVKLAGHVARLASGHSRRRGCDGRCACAPWPCRRRDPGRNPRGSPWPGGRWLPVCGRLDAIPAKRCRPADHRLHGPPRPGGENLMPTTSSSAQSRGGPRLVRPPVALGRFAHRAWSWEVPLSAPSGPRFAFSSTLR